MKEKSLYEQLKQAGISEDKMRVIKAHEISDEKIKKENPDVRRAIIRERNRNGK